MLPLRGAQMLQTLEKTLVKSLPASLKVYGTVFHINRGNPFKLKALVDKWPDFHTVVIRPQEQDMTDDLDHYNNTYQVYSEDPPKAQEFLGSPAVINWKQHFQIQSSQSSLNEVIQNLAAAKSHQVQRSENLLYMAPQTAKKLAPALLEAAGLSPSGGKPRAIDQDMFRLSSLDVTHATFLNKFWSFGGNERSQRFIERCIRSFPSFCLLGPEGTLASWSLMDQTGETRVAGTLPEYRSRGLVSYVVYKQGLAMDRLGFPVYSHVDKSNTAMQRMSDTLHHVPMPCGWHQWRCVPL